MGGVGLIDKKMKKNQGKIGDFAALAGLKRASDLVISGNATFDKETGFLTFGKKGTVKVKYTVTNAFGTFESNELTLTYDDGKTETKKSGCGSSVAGAGMIGFAALGMAAIAIKKRRK